MSEVKIEPIAWVETTSEQHEMRLMVYDPRLASGVNAMLGQQFQMPCRSATDEHLRRALAAMPEERRRAILDVPAEFDRVGRVIRAMADWTPECRAGLVREIARRWPESAQSDGGGKAGPPCICDTVHVMNCPRHFDPACQQQPARPDGGVPRWKFDDLADELKKALADAAGYRASLAVVRTPTDGVWFWEGAGDKVDTLSCPVVMRPETLRDLLARAEKAEALAAGKADDARELSARRWLDEWERHEGRGRRLEWLPRTRGNPWTLHAYQGEDDIEAIQVAPTHIALAEKLGWTYAPDGERGEKETP